MQNNQVIQDLKNKTPEQIVDMAKSMNDEDKFYLMKTYKYLAKIEKETARLDKKGISYDHILKD